MKLDEILTEMTGWAEPSDPEIAHGRADDLLVDLARTLARRSKHKEQVERILAKYEAVEKWYS